MGFLIFFGFGWAMGLGSIDFFFVGGGGEVGGGKGGLGGPVKVGWGFGYYKYLFFWAEGAQAPY